MNHPEAAKSSSLNSVRPNGAGGKIEQRRGDVARMN